MTLSIPRRAFISGLASLIAAPAVIRVAKLMPISMQRPHVITLAEYAKMMERRWAAEEQAIEGFGRLWAQMFIHGDQSFKPFERSLG